MATLVGSALLMWVALHRNLFGPGGQLESLFVGVWQWASAALGRPDAKYPVTAWADGFLFRPSVIGMWTGYLALLVVLRFSPWGRKRSLRTLLIAATLVATPLMLMPHLMSSDLFDYSSYARLVLIHQSNPYTSSISEFPADPFFPVTCWKAATSVYGPAWTMMSIAMVAFCELLGGSMGLYVVVFRAVMFGFQVACAAMIWGILTRAGAKDRAFKTAIFLFNPLVMIEFAGNGHNEAMMIACLLGGVALAQRGRWALAALSFTLAAQTKLYCLPIFCFYVAHRCWKSGSPREALQRLAGLAFIFVAVSTALYLPFGLDRTTVLSPLHGPGGDSMTKSLGDYLASKSSVPLEKLPVVGVMFRGYQYKDIRTMALIFTFIACLGGALYSRSFSRAVTAATFFSLFWCLIGATWFMPWYVTLPVALIPLCQSRPVAVAGWSLSLTVFIIYLLEGWSFSRAAGPHNFGVDHYEIMVFVPPMIVLAVAHAADRYVARKRIDTLAAKSR